jgi:hypothetical protein
LQLGKLDVLAASGSGQGLSEGVICMKWSIFLESAQSE